MFWADKKIESFFFVILISSISLIAHCQHIDDFDYPSPDEIDYDFYHPKHNRDNDLRTTTVVYQPRPYPSMANPNSDTVLLPRFGLIRGKVPYKNILGRQINAWLGVKFGSVGTGLKRFQPATRYQHFSNEPFDATKEADACPQFPTIKNVTEKESQGINVDDCLTLNIYAPARAGQYPVMVFVHGEMLFDGSAEEGQPDYLMEKDIVLVSVNYRLAPVGFLSTLTKEMPGNVALDDIKIALEWVNQHIRHFNGNPEKVTLFGQAGGATLVHALSISGKAQGLFHQLILQSGTALNPYFIDEDPATTIRTFARFARCSIDHTEMESINMCFERMSTSELINLFKRHWDYNELRGLRYAGGFKLVIGDQLGYLTRPPASLIANNMVPMIAGVAKDAGAFIMSRFFVQLQQVRSTNITDFINVVLKHTAQPRHHSYWRNIAVEKIFTEKERRMPTLSTLAEGLLELTNLILYRAPVLDSIHYTYKSYPTYLYYFGYRGEFRRFGHLENPLPFAIDATLSDDNIYLFPYPEDVSQLNAQDKAISRYLVQLWTNFAIEGTPNYGTNVWPNVTDDEGPFLRFFNSPNSPVEVDVSFTEGIDRPNLYPEYFTTTTTTTTRSPPYAAYDRYNNPYNYQQQNRPAPQPYRRPYETVLPNPNIY